MATDYITYCCASPPHGLNQIDQLLLQDDTPLFHQGTCKFPDISAGNGPSSDPPIQKVPDVLNGIEIQALHWQCLITEIPVLQKFKHKMSSIAGGIVMLEGHVRMSLQKRDHMREEDVFPVTHNIQCVYMDSNYRLV